nr:hypothetical protein [Tanacetum cinerariifolium]GFA60512.1 hypothetical protein [Tanacetum cinerariifolium]GFA61083.1 hypothetical protein [Tanacetum cinerariifolium]
MAQSSALLTVADDPDHPLRDVSQGEAFLTDSGFIADQDRATVAKSSSLPMIQHQGLLPLMLLRAAQEVEINMLKDKVKLLEDREGVAATRSGDDAPIKGKSMDEGEVATKRISDDSEEMAIVLTSMDAATVLTSRVVDVPTGSGYIPTASTPAEERRKGKEVMVESKTLKKQKVQEQIDAHVSRELEEQLERERGSEKEYHQSASELPMERRIELITDLVKGMTFEEVEAKFNSVWKQMEDFIPIGLKKEVERIKRKGPNLEQESAKKQKTSEEVPEEVKSPKEVHKEKVKEMMQLVPIKEVYVDALQVKHPIIDWKV